MKMHSAMILAVAVFAGSVRVDWNGQTITLNAGENRVFAEEAQPSTPGAPPAVTPPSTPPARVDPPPARGGPPRAENKPVESAPAAEQTSVTPPAASNRGRTGSSAPAAEAPARGNRGRSTAPETVEDGGRFNRTPARTDAPPATSAPAAPEKPEEAPRR